MPQKITLYNSLTRKKEALTPLEKNHIRLYACGITVYDDCHIGHAMQAVYFDVFRRFLEFAGYKVTYVRNYTDVDDKIINKAKTLGISPKALAESIIASSEKDMEALGVAPASHEPKVSDHIPEIISMIEALIKNDAAYVTPEGDVYYKVKEKDDYGKLSGRKTEELRSGTRDLSSGTKEEALDFALWKCDKTPDASWESPWGQGRPGWHIECSALAKEFLGNSFDIHGGGLDLIFPHHENEIAQSESANQCPYASFWLHSGLLTLNKQKMSKSLGNHIFIKDFLKSWDPEVLRLAFLQNHYSSNIDFSEQVFVNCRKRLYYYYQSLLELEKASKSLSEEEKMKAKALDTSLVDGFKQAMSDDFNSSSAIAEINMFVREANKALMGKKNPGRFYNMAHQMKTIGKVLGLFHQEAEAFIRLNNEVLLKEIGMTEAKIKEEIEKRAEARTQKNWAESDRIRDGLLEKGISLKDNPDGTTWSLTETL